MIIEIRLDDVLPIFVLAMVIEFALISAYPVVRLILRTTGEIDGTKQ